MKIYIIDHQPIYMIGLKKHMEDKLGIEAQIDYEKLIDKVDVENLQFADVIVVNLSLFTELIRQPVLRLKKINSRVKIIGLVEEENKDIMNYMDLTVFDALVPRQLIFDELDILMGSFKENKKYYSTDIVEFINNNTELKFKFFSYERN